MSESNNSLSSMLHARYCSFSTDSLTGRPTSISTLILIVIIVSITLLMIIMVTILLIGLRVYIMFHKSVSKNYQSVLSTL